MVNLQCNGTILMEEREQALRAAEQLKMELAESKWSIEDLAGEKKELEAKVSDLQGKNGELEARNGKL